MYKPKEIKRLKKTIIEKIKEGKSINEIETKNGIPSNDTIYKWLNNDAQFKDNYLRARGDQALFYAEKIDNVIKELPDAPTREQLDKARLQIDAYKWTASKLLPKIYGAAAAQTNIQVNVQPVTGMEIFDDGLPESSDNKDN